MNAEKVKLGGGSQTSPVSPFEAAQVLVDDLGGGAAESGCAQCKKTLTNGLVAVPWLRATARTFASFDLCFCCSETCASAFAVRVAEREARFVKTSPAEHRQSLVEALARTFGADTDARGLGTFEPRSFNDAEAAE
jgi:hypothetical protein